MAKGLLVIMVLAFAIAYVHVDRDNSNLQAQVTKLNHACIPTDTGGGVTQCFQPSVNQNQLVSYKSQNALYACAKNHAYTRGMLFQCISDYWNSTKTGLYNITEACVKFTFEQGSPSEVWELVTIGKAEC